MSSVCQFCGEEYRGMYADPHNCKDNRGTEPTSTSGIETIKPVNIWAVPPDYKPEPLRPTIFLSVLICSVPERVIALAGLLNELQRQIVGHPVEIICLMDNRLISVGEKRQKLLELAHGEFVTYIDDDDWIMPDYISTIMEILEQRERPTGYPDVICPEVKVTIDGGQEGIVEMSVEYAKGPMQQYGAPRTFRPPHELAIWRRTLAIQSEFPAVSYGEDFAWAAKLWPLVKYEVKISKPIYWWRHNTAEEIHES